MVTAINDWLDRLPRARFGARSREVPAFRTIGVAGFYLAVLVTMGSGLAAGKSPVVLAVVSVACGLSFFVWALVRRAVIGRESFVLLEHVWFALAWAAVVVVALGEPVLAYLDVVALGLCAFLGVGRIGCLVVGCCHGQPSIVGIRYGPELVDDGLPSWLVGVRLFPVQLVEAVGIGAIGLVGLVLLPFASEGTVFTWFLVAYAVLRFGMEGLRGDDRAEVAGMSVPRWMALAQSGVALGIADPSRALGPAGAFLVGLVVVTVGLAAVWRRQGPERTLTDPASIDDIRRFVATSPTPSGRELATRSYPSGLSVAVSQSPEGDGFVHVSFALPPGRSDLRRLSAIAGAIIPRPVPGSVVYGKRGVLHVVGLRDPSGVPGATSSTPPALVVYRDAVRSLQGDGNTRETDPVMTERTSAGRESYFESLAANLQPTGEPLNGTGFDGRLGAGSTR